mmetsp:Transcript_16060/g.46116  ORF Transcript_16060/g.46116 Transcript_16060/m.46116 type:complete len:159 (-) Transcript_16060:96-572(-)
MHWNYVSLVMPAAVAGALLTRSYTNATLQETIDDRVGRKTDNNDKPDEGDVMDVDSGDGSTEEEVDDDVIPAARKTMGWRQFRTLQVLWSVIVEGDPTPKRLYSFRVDPEKLAAAVEYLMTVLHVLPGQYRSVKLDGQVINNLLRLHVLVARGWLAQR